MFMHDQVELFTPYLEEKRGKVWKIKFACTECNVYTMFR